MSSRGGHPGDLGEQLVLGFDDGQDDEPETRPVRPASRPIVPAPAAADIVEEVVERVAAVIEEFGQLGLDNVPRGRQRRPAISSEVWAALLADPATRASYDSKIYRGTYACQPFLGAISDSGHGKLRISRKLRTSVQVVTAHVYGWQLHHGIIAARPGEDLVIAHKCDEASCQRPDHWELLPRGDNAADYMNRRHGGPLADVRGTHGRAVAIRNAILTAHATGTDVDAAFAAARAAGLDPTPGLF
ncbi:hypothetical protein GCM10027589_04710 [Actinocorallia lasiicapitis]